MPSPRQPRPSPLPGSTRPSGEFAWTVLRRCHAKERTSGVGCRVMATNGNMHTHLVAGKSGVNGKRGGNTNKDVLLLGITTRSSMYACVPYLALRLTQVGAEHSGYWSRPNFLSVGPHHRGGQALSRRRLSDQDNTPWLEVKRRGSAGQGRKGGGDG